MAGFLTDYVNNKVLDCFFGGLAIKPPPALYIGLSSGRSSKSGSVSEPSGGSYSRVAVANDLDHFPTASGGTKFNMTAISFPTPSASWGQVLSVFIADSPVEGHVLAMADLPSSRTINFGDLPPTIAVNALFLSHN